MLGRAIEIPPFVSFGEIAQGAADAARPPRKVSVSEFAARHRRLSNPGGGYSGQWRNDMAPHLVEIMDRSTSRAVEMVVYVGPAQTAKKTELLLNLIGHAAKYDARGMLAFQPTKELAKDFMQRRVERGCFDISPDLRGLIGEDRSDDTAFQKIFRNGASLTVGWPVSSQLASRPVATVLLDEIDSMPDDINGEGSPVKLAKKRNTTFGRNAKIVVVSSPKRLDYSGIMPLWDSGDRCLWHWPCAECGDYFTPGFDADRKPTLAQLYVPDGATPEIARREARLVCPHCGVPLEDRHKAGMRQRGLWLPVGCRITRDGSIIGARPDTRIASYWFSGFAASELTWGDIAFELVSARLRLEQHGDDTDLKTCWNTTIGAPYKPELEAKDRLDPAVFEARAAADTMPLGVLPADTLFVTAAVDVQANMFVTTAIAWRAGGQCRVVDHRKIFKTTRGGVEVPLDPAGSLEDWNLLFGEVVDRAYPVAGDGNKPAMRPLLATIDLHGKKGTTGQAYAFWLRARRRDREAVLQRQADPQYRKRILLVRGGNLVHAPLISMRLIETDNRGKPLKKGIKLATLNVSSIKDMAAARLRKDRPGPGFVAFSHELPAEYFAELCAEYKDDSGAWQKLQDRNEAWDLFVYNLAAFIRLGGLRKDWGAAPVAVPVDGAAAAEDSPRAPATVDTPAPAPISDRAASIAAVHPSAPAPVSVRPAVIATIATRRRGVRGRVGA